MLLLNGISAWLKFKLIVYSEAADWPEICYVGKRQSPIRVCKKKAKSTPMPPLQFYFYGQRFKAFIENKGVTVEIRIDDREACGTLPTIKGGNLPFEYVLHSVHFHWEAEHTIDGKRHPLECHCLHYKKNCEDLTQAMTDPDGLLMLSVMFEVTNCVNPNLECLISGVETVAKEVKQPKQLLGGIVVDKVLPKNRNKFFTYDGSRTSPNCEENVKWIIFEETLPIDRDQLKRITNIDSKSGERIKKNFRPIQDLNDREVLYSSGLQVGNFKGYVKEQWGKLWS